MPTLPPLSKTWQFNVNQSTGGTGSVATDLQGVVLAIVNSFVGFATLPWTVVGSSNSVAAGLDAVNRWVTISNVVFAGPSSAHSWIVLKQAGIATNFQMLISCGVNTTNTLRISFSQSAGFTGGSTTADPTATDQYWIGGSTATDTTWSPTNVGFNGKLHVWQSTDGQSTRVVHMVSSFVTTLFVIDKPGSSPTGFTNPCACVVLSQGSFGNETCTYTLLCRTAQANSRGGSTPIRFVMFFSVEGANAKELGADMTFANDFDSSYPILPIGLYCNTGANVRGRHGTLIDLWFGSTANAAGTTYPNDTSKQFVQFGHMIFPWNGSTPLTS